MKWINHQATAFCVTIAIVPDPIMAALAAVSASLPDAIETTRGGIRYAPHRGISHDIAFWLPVLIGLLLVTHWPGIIPPLPICGSIPRYLAYAITGGVLIHLVTDSLSKGGVPVLGSGRIALGFYKTFTWSEYKVSAMICLPALGLAWRLGHLSWGMNNLAKYICW